MIRVLESMGNAGIKKAERRRAPQTESIQLCAAVGVFAELQVRRRSAVALLVSTIRRLRLWHHRTAIP